MSEQRRLAIIVVRNDPTTPLPNLADVMDLVLFSPSSIARYFKESAEDYFQLSRVDFFGPYDVTLPAAPSSRDVGIGAARNAASDAGADLSPYDGTVVFAFPGTGYDAGAYGSSAFLPVTSDFSFFCHEVGHVLGLDHSYGIFTTGADWIDNDKPDLFPVYGDPYDLMSSATFGGADPTSSRPPADVPAAHPSWASAPPHIARALLHHQKPAALEDKGRVVHVNESQDVTTTLYPVGTATDGKPELIVFHPTGEDGAAHGRVYVEYRQPFDHNPHSRWDKGLAGANQPGARDRCGVIVHTVVDQPGVTPGPVVWYSGRIVFPTPDTDVAVDTPLGQVHVGVTQEYGQTTRPGYVRLRVRRTSTPSVTVRTTSTDSTRVVYSERRPHPGWEWAGDFTWETRETVRATTYTPVTVGIGGASPIDAESSVVLSWFVGGAQVFGVASSIPVSLPDGRVVTLEAILADNTRVLTLRNHPADGAIEVPVVARASEADGTPEVFATSAYAVQGQTSGWGSDWDRFMDFWYRITHPIPRERIGPPDPGDPLQRFDPLAEVARQQLERVREAYAELAAVSPAVAENVRSVMADQERMLAPQRVKAVSIQRRVG
jgi:hypothetical protein